MRVGATFLLVSLSSCCKRPGAPEDAPRTTVAPSATSAIPATTAPPVGPDGLPLEIPTTRTPAPSLQDWNNAADLKVPSALPLRCEVNMIREWVRVNCSGKRRSGGAPQGVRILGGCTQDTYTSMRSNANLVTALSQGRRCEVEFSWTDGKEIFVAEWLQGSRPALGFLPAPAAPLPSSSTPPIRIAPRIRR